MEWVVFFVIISYKILTFVVWLDEPEDNPTPLTTSCLEVEEDLIEHVDWLKEGF